MCSVRVCVPVRIYTPTSTYTPTCVKNRQDTDNTPISPSVKNKPPRQGTSALRWYTSWTPPSSFPNAEWTSCTCMSAYADPVASVCANVYADVHNTCLTYTSAHAWCSQHLSKCTHTLCKNARALLHADLCNGTEASLSWKLLRTYLESCASIVQAVVCRPPWLMSRRNRSPDAVRSKFV